MAFRIFNSILSVNILMASLLLFLISVHAGIFCCRFHFLFPCFLWPRGVCYVLEFAKEKKQCKGGWYAYWTEVGSAWALQGQLFATTVWACHLNFSDVSASYHPYHRPTSLPLEKWIWGLVVNLAGSCYNWECLHPDLVLLYSLRGNFLFVAFPSSLLRSISYSCSLVPCSCIWIVATKVAIALFPSLLCELIQGWGREH